MEPFTPHRRPSKDGDGMLSSQVEHERPHLGEHALPSTESVTGGVCSHSLPPYSPIEPFRKTPRGQERSKKKKILKKKNPPPNKHWSVRTIPPAGPGFYFYRVMNKPQYRGGGEPRCLRLLVRGRPLRAEGGSFRGNRSIPVAAG